MDLNKILLACDARAFAIALGEYMESKASKSIEFVNRLLDMEAIIHKYFEDYIESTNTPTSNGWSSYVYEHQQDMFNEIANAAHGSAELEKYYFKGSSNETMKLVDFVTNSLGEQWHEYTYGAPSKTDHLQSLAQRMMNGAYACLAEGAAYRSLGLGEKLDVQTTILTFDSLLASNLNSKDPIVNNLRSYIIGKLQNSSNIVEYITQTQEAENFDTIPNGSLAYQYTGAHPIVAFTIDCESILSAVSTSWQWVFNFYSNMFKTFISVGKNVINQVYNFFSSLTVDPACVSFNSNGSAYTMDTFFHEDNIVAVDSANHVNRFNNVIKELEKGPISINLVTSENILFLKTDESGVKKIVRRSKQKLVGDLTSVFNSLLAGHGTTYTDEEVTQIVEKTVPCIDPASVSSSTGRLMLQSFYQSDFLERFIHMYLARCYGLSLSTVYPWTWDQFKDMFLSTANTGSNEKYYKFASADELYNTLINKYVVGPSASSWIDVLLPLLDSILGQQDVSGAAMEGAFFPYSHSIVNFRSSKIVILTDEQVAQSWTTKLATTVAVVVATAVLCKTVTKYRRAVTTANLEKEAYWYQMQSQIQSTGKYDPATFTKFKTANRKSNMLGLIGRGLSNSDEFVSSSLLQSQCDLKTVIGLINPSAIK